jgi:O-antigen ligase
MTRIYWFSATGLFLAWLLPLHVLPWMSWHNEVLAATTVLVACGWACLRAPAGSVVALPAVAALPLAVAAAAALQFAAGRIAFAGSLWAIAGHAAVAAAAAVAGHAVARRGEAEGAQALDILARGILVAGACQLFVIAGQTLGLWGGSDLVARTAYLTRGSGNVAQPNQAALIFVFALASAAYLQVRGVLRPAVAVAAVVCMALGLAATESRSGAVGAAAIALWFAWWRRGQGLSWPRALAPSAVFALLLVLFFAAWPRLMGALWQQATDGVNLTTSGRTEMWGQFAQAVLLRPWFGWGVMQVAEAQNAIASSHAAVMAATFAHNVLLDLALWLGIPGMLLVAGATLAWFVPRMARAVTPAAAYCVALALPMLTQSMTEFPYAYAYFLAPVFFALGALGGLQGRERALALPRNAALALLGAWCVLHAWAAKEYVQIEEDFRVARFEALRVGQTPEHYATPRLHLLTQLDALLRATRLQARPGLTEAEMALLEDVAKLYPWGAPTFRYATALALNGRMDEAHRQLQVLRATSTPKTFTGLMEALDEMAQQYPVLKQLRQP